MEGKLKNIIEDVARDFLNHTLALRYDICTCPTCKNDMLAYILSRVPPKYVTTETGALHMLIEQTRIEHQAEIGRAVINAIDIVSKNPRHQPIEDKQQSFDLLLDKIQENRGLDLRHYRQELLRRRVALRIRANNLNSYSEYLRLLIRNPDEYTALFNVLCINVSEFFRDPEVWITAKYLLENVIRKKIRMEDRIIRIWSAGCASGEEAYSIAILLKEMLPEDMRSFFIKIYATDIDRDTIKNALKAEYQKDSVKNVDSKYLDRYFILTSGRQNYKLKQEIKDMVEFQYQDLTGEEYITDTDVVFCRNVFIYYSLSLQEMILMKFYKSLSPKGYLVMGRVESILNEAREIFDEVDSNARIYQKKELRNTEGKTL